MPYSSKTALATIEDWEHIPITGLDVRLAVTFYDPAGTSVVDHKDHQLQHSNEERRLHHNLTSDTMYFTVKNTSAGSSRSINTSKNTSAAIACVATKHVTETEDGARVASRRMVANLAPGEDTGLTELPPGCSLAAEPQPATLIWTRDRWLDITGRLSTDRAAQRLITNCLADLGNIPGVSDINVREQPPTPDFGTPDLAVDIAGTRTDWEIKAIHTSRNHEKVAEQLAESGRATHTFVNEAYGYARRLINADRPLAGAAETGRPTIAALVNLTAPRDPYVTEPYSIASMLKGKPEVNLQTGTADRKFQTASASRTSVQSLFSTSSPSIPSPRTGPSRALVSGMIWRFSRTSSSTTIPTPESDSTPRSRAASGFRNTKWSSDLPANQPAVPGYPFPGPTVP